MKQKHLYYLPVFFLILSSCSPSTSPVEEGSDSPPNIIYIYADDLGYGEIEPYGQEKIKTPNLKRMAAEGLTFTQHYTSTPVCAPARCALMTGLHTGHTYIRGNGEYGKFTFNDEDETGQLPLPAGTFTVGKLMKRAGYKTGAIGKWGLGMTGNSGHPNKQGFDYFYGYLDQKQAHNFYPTHLWENTEWDSLENPFIYVHAIKSIKNPKINVKARAAFANSHLRSGDEGFFDAYKGNEYSIDAMTGRAERFIRNNKDSAFFLYLPYTLPHVSLQVPDSALHQYVGQFEEEPYLGTHSYSPQKYPRSAYAAMITYLDSQVGRILALLEELDLDENTLVMFSSDNGAGFNEFIDTEFFNSTAGLRGLKMQVYEGGIRVPMIAWWPGKVKAGTTTRHPSVQYDVMATLADLVGAKVPEHTDGVSFLPTLLGEAEEQKKHDFLYFEYPEKGGQLAIRIGKWKGVKTDLVRHPDNPWQIYDMEMDSLETTDVSRDHPELLAKLDEIAVREHEPSHIEKWNFMEQVLEASAE